MHPLDTQPTVAPADPTAGDDDEAEAEAPARLRLRSPAVIVLAIAVVIVVGGIVASALAVQGNPTLRLKSLTLPDGTTVALTPAATALKPIIEAEPPADILASLAVPTGSTETSFVNSDQDQTQYDRSISFTSGLSSDQLVAFYQTLLPKLGWRVTATAPDTAERAGTTEVLATKGSDDGFYWTVGAVVSPSDASGTTHFTLTLYEQPDED